MTPFISTTSSLLRALSYAYSRKHPSSIAVIDLHKAGKVEDYEDDSNPFLQNVYRLNLKPGDPYKGISEVKGHFRVVMLQPDIEQFLIYGEIKEEAILCVLTLTHFMSCLPSLSSDDDPFGFRHLQPSEKLRETSQCLCESSECSCKSSKYLHEVRSLIRKKSLPTNFYTGQIVGKLLKVLELSEDYLNDGTSTIAKDWGFRGWRSNEAFNKGVSDGFRKDHVPRFPDLNLLGCLRLKASLEEAATISSHEEVHEEDLIQSNVDEMCWSPDTLTDDSRIFQEPLEFSFDKFIQELRNAAKIRRPTKT